MKQRCMLIRELLKQKEKMNSLILIISILVLSMLFSCEEDRDEAQGARSYDEYEQNTGIPLDTLEKWTAYVQSSDEGLWEDDPDHSLILGRVAALGGENDLSPPFYDPLYIHVISDTLLIADQATQELVCMNSSGELFWKAGDIGEGPGHFHGIGTMANAGNLIAVANTGLDRIDIFTCSGEFSRTISIQSPEDLIGVSDSTIIVLSGTEPNGDVHLVNLNTGEFDSSEKLRKILRWFST